MKSVIIISLVIILLGSCSTGQEKETQTQEVEKQLILTLSNPKSEEIENAHIVISRDSIESILGAIPAETTPVLKDENQQVIPFQTDDFDQDGQWDAYVFMNRFMANQTKVLPIEFIKNDSLPTFESTTNVHLGRKPDEATPVQPIEYVMLYKDKLTPYQANQVDGPGWENELVGYRLYLDGRNMRDVFGKRRTAIVLPEVGLSEEGNPVDNYHVLEDWGRDILSVGSSLGAGGIALYEDGKLTRLGLTRPETIDNVDSTEYRLINKGPIRAIFEVNYYGWETPSGKLNVHNRISIWKGSYGYVNQTTVSGFEGEKTIVTGLVNSNNDQPTIEKQLGNLQLLATHDKQTYNKEYFLGLALAVPSAIFSRWEEAPETGKINTTRFAKLNVKLDTPFTYHVFSGWELQDTGFTKKDYFMQKVEKEVKEIQNSSSIRIY